MADDRDVTWNYYDTSHKLVINDPDDKYGNASLTGTLNLDGENSEGSWDAVRDRILSVEFAYNTAPTITSGWFKNCSRLSRFDDTNFSTSQITDASNMFQGCHSLRDTVFLSLWDMSSVTDLTGMFQDCNTTRVFYLDNWKISNNANISSMFKNCSYLEAIFCNNTWTPADTSDTFTGCSLLHSITNGSKFTSGVVTTNPTNGLFTYPMSIKNMYLMGNYVNNEDSSRSLVWGESDLSHEFYDNSNTWSKMGGRKCFINSLYNYNEPLFPVRPAPDNLLTPEDVIAAAIHSKKDPDGIYEKLKDQLTGPISFGTYGDIQFRLVGIQHDDLADDSGKADLSFIATKQPSIYSAIGETDTNSGGFVEQGTVMRQSLRTLFEAMDPNWSKLIVPVNKTSNTSTSSTTTFKFDNLWIPSFTELGWVNSGPPTIKEGTPYKYFEDSIDQFTLGVAHKRYCPGKALVWTRSIITTSSANFGGTHVDGNWAQNPATDELGIQLGFCVHIPPESVDIKQFRATSMNYQKITTDPREYRNFKSVFTYLETVEDDNSNLILKIHDASEKSNIADIILTTLPDYEADKIVMLDVTDYSGKLILNNVEFSGSDTQSQSTVMLGPGGTTVKEDTVIRGKNYYSAFGVTPGIVGKVHFNGTVAGNLSAQDAPIITANHNGDIEIEYTGDNTVSNEGIVISNMANSGKSFSYQNGNTRIKISGTGTLNLLSTGTSQSYGQPIACAIYQVTNTGYNSDVDFYGPGEVVLQGESTINGGFGIYGVGNYMDYDYKNSFSVYGGKLTVHGADESAPVHTGNALYVYNGGEYSGMFLNVHGGEVYIDGGKNSSGSYATGAICGFFVTIDGYDKDESGSYIGPTVSLAGNHAFNTHSSYNATLTVESESESADIPFVVKTNSQTREPEDDSGSSSDTSFSTTDGISDLTSIGKNTLWMRVTHR